MEQTRLTIGFSFVLFFVLLAQILEAYGLAAPAFALYASRDRTRQVSASKSTTLSSLGLRHGDMLFLFPDKNAAAAAGVDAAAAAAPAVAAAQIQGSKIPTRSNVQEEPVDALLHKMDGKIKRKRDPKTSVAPILHFRTQESRS